MKTQGLSLQVKTVFKWKWNSNKSSNLQLEPVVDKKHTTARSEAMAALKDYYKK